MKISSWKLILQQLYVRLWLRTNSFSLIRRRGLFLMCGALSTLITNRTRILSSRFLWNHRALGTHASSSACLGTHEKSVFRTYILTDKTTQFYSFNLMSVEFKLCSKVALAKAFKMCASFVSYDRIFIEPFFFIYSYNKLFLNVFNSSWMKNFTVLKILS